MPSRRPAVLLAGAMALATLVGCAGDDDPGAADAPTATAPDGDGTAAGTATPTRPALPEPAASFLAAAARDTATFSADYHVLRKLGGLEADVRVAQEPPWLEVRTGDVVVRSGPAPATCRVAAGLCVGEVREEPLAAVGVFSGFATTGPAEAVATLAARSDAASTTSVRRSAGVDLRCLDVAVRGTPAGTWCLTPEGVFGFVDTVVARYELRSYAPTAEVADEPPGELVVDDGFLLAP